MTVQIPKALIDNSIAHILDEIRYNYGKLTRAGYIVGLMAIDQDAKIIAIDSRFDKNLNYWDLSSIGAALYGVARQGKDFFEADYMERANIIYNNMRLFVKCITDVKIEQNRTREIIIVMLCDNHVNEGVAILQMKRFAIRIKNDIEKDGSIKDTLAMNEKKLKEHIKLLKKELLGKEFVSTGDT
jgi:hypothetical protein